MSTLASSLQTGWGVMEVKSEDDGLMEEVHILYGTVLPDGSFSHCGHILADCCDCKPRVEVDNHIPMIVHRHNA